MTSVLGSIPVAIVGILALNLVAGNHALTVKRRDRLSPIDAQYFCNWFFFGMALLGAVAMGLVHLSMEDPPESYWWVYAGPTVALPVALAIAWWSAGEWPIRVISFPLFGGIPWDSNDLSEPENTRRR